MTTREVCGWQIQFEGSCFDDEKNRVTINVARCRPNTWPFPTGAR